MVLNNRPVGKGKVGPDFFCRSHWEARPHSFVSIEKSSQFQCDFPGVCDRAGDREGPVLFAMYCGRCHGGNVVSGGSVPDLRYAEEPTHQCSRKSCGRARREFGMAVISRGTSRQSKFDSSTHTSSTAVVSQPEQMAAHK